jgi:hypothetical protein
MVTLVRVVGARLRIFGSPYSAKARISDSVGRPTDDDARWTQCPSVFERRNDVEAVEQFENE